MGNSAESFAAEASSCQHLRLGSCLLLATACQRGEYQEKTAQHPPSPCAIPHHLILGSDNTGCLDPVIVSHKVFNHTRGTSKMKGLRIQRHVAPPLAPK